MSRLTPNLNLRPWIVSPDEYGQPAARPTEGLTNRLIARAVRLGEELAAGRSQRVIVLIAAVWVLNGFDLHYTLAEVGHGFVEANPIAAKLLDGPPELVIAYKAKLVLLASTILITLRRHPLTESACWLLLAAYSYVALRWAHYYAGCFVVLSDPALNHGLDWWY